MRSAVITFPGSNCDRDMAVALERLSGNAPVRLWHQETDIPDVDLIAIPGGFSFGDYLRCGAISAQSPIMAVVRKAAEKGVTIIGICNGFQILLEAQLLPGALMRNERLTFICKDACLEVASKDSRFTKAYGDITTLTIPVAHHDGNYTASTETLDRLESEDRIIFRYRENINGSARRIAGISNKRGNVLGMMPHPERAVDPTHGGTDGAGFFKSLIDTTPIATL